MSSLRRSFPHQMPAGPLPIRVRPAHGEQSGSYLIRLAAANRCPTRTILQLLGRVHSGTRPDQGAHLHPQSMISMNTAALHRLALYCGIPVSHLLTALPELDHQRTESREPILRVGPSKHTFLRSCPECERRTGGAVLAPDRRPLQLTCRRHGTWLVKADPLLSIHPVPEVRRAAGTLLRQQHRYTAATIKTLYATVRGYLTFDWRGLGWHNHLAKRWTARQQILRPDADRTDLYLPARTEHWSMLPEAVAIITVLADACSSPPLTNAHVHHDVANSLSRALRLDEYWSIGTNADFHPDHSFRHLHQLLVGHPHLQPAAADDSERAPQSVPVEAAS